MKKYLILFQIYGDFGHTVIDEDIPSDEVEYVVTRHAERLYPDAEHLYYLDEVGDFTVDIIINDVCRDRMVYCA